MTLGSAVLVLAALTAGILAATGALLLGLGAPPRCGPVPAWTGVVAQALLAASLLGNAVQAALRHHPDHGAEP